MLGPVERWHSCGPSRSVLVTWHVIDDFELRRRADRPRRSRVRERPASGIRLARQGRCPASPARPQESSVRRSVSGIDCRTAGRAQRELACDNPRNRRRLLVPGHRSASDRRWLSPRLNGALGQRPPRPPERSSSSGRCAEPGVFRATWTEIAVGIKMPLAFRQIPDIMSHDWIAVRGARVHNLKNIDVDLPRDRWSSLPGCPARVSRRSPSTPSTPKGSAATSSRSPPTPGSSSSRWRSPTST